ncbi:MAG: hypothetical protein LBQ61_01050 [Spirochaetales bacterium]|nr:hypothetical protein [Spirochaetales bacterium]
MIKIRITAFIAAGAFIFSFVLGLFHDVTPGGLFFRGLCSALAMAALFNGAYFVCRRFLPELFDSPGEPEAGEDSEDPDQIFMGDGPAGPPAGERINIVLDGEGEGELEDELADELEDAGEDAPARAPAAPQADRPAGVPPVGAAIPGDSSGAELEPEDEEELETLDEEEGDEDLGVLEGAFNGGASSGASPQAPKKVTIDLLGGEHHPDEAAMAIQTMLKKD